MTQSPLFIFTIILELFGLVATITPLLLPPQKTDFQTIRTFCPFLKYTLHSLNNRANKRIHFTTKFPNFIRVVGDSVNRKVEHYRKECPCLEFFHYTLLFVCLENGSFGGTWTHTPCGQQILSLSCLPVPPRSHINNITSRHARVKVFLSKKCQSD